MTRRAKMLLTLIVIILMTALGLTIIEYLTEPIIEKQAEYTSLRAEIKMSPDDYADLVSQLEEKRLELTDKINRQTEQIQVIESSMAFLLKEDVLTKVSDAIKNTGATFNNFYVTNEGTIKNDYSVQVYGDIYQINEFIQNMCTDSPGISIGEFSIREDEDSDFLLRYFDESNTLIWYDGTIYNGPDLPEGVTPESQADALKELQKIVNYRLPNAKDITYTMTLTFRV